MDEKTIKAAVLDAFEVSLDAQLRAIRRLKQDKDKTKAGRTRREEKAARPLLLSVQGESFR